MTYTIITKSYPTLDDASVAFDAIHDWMRLYRVDAFLQAMRLPEQPDDIVVLLGVHDKHTQYMDKIRESDWKGGTSIVIDVSHVMAAEASHSRQKEQHDFDSGELDRRTDFDQPVALMSDGTIAEPGDDA